MQVGLNEYAIRKYTKCKKTINIRIHRRKKAKYITYLFFR